MVRTVIISNQSSFSLPEYVGSYVACGPQKTTHHCGRSLRRYGERVSTGFVESTVNTVVGKRFGKRQQMGPIGRFLLRTPLRKTFQRTSQVPQFLMGLILSGRAILRSAALECQSKSPERMTCSHPSGDVCGSSPTSYSELVCARCLAALAM